MGSGSERRQVRNEDLITNGLVGWADMKRSKPTELINNHRNFVSYVRHDLLINKVHINATGTDLLCVLQEKLCVEGNPPTEHAQ